jgi:Fe-S-cluster formation regulator IscX/YfhJ
LENVTDNDVKNIGIDLQNKWNCNNTDPVYIEIRETQLKKFIAELATLRANKQTNE